MKFIYLNWISILIPFFVGLTNFKSFDKSLKILFFFICVGTANEIVVRLLIWLADVENTMPSNHLYGLITCSLLFFFYYNLFEKGKKIILFVNVLFSLYWIINSLFVQGIFEYPSIPRSIGNIIIIILVVLYFYKIMLEAKIVKLANDPLIWINTAILVYYAGNMFFSVLFNIILEVSREFLKVTAYYYSGLMTLFYILIAIGFIKARKRKLALESSK